MADKRSVADTENQKCMWNTVNLNIFSMPKTSMWSFRCSWVGFFFFFAETWEPWIGWKIYFSILFGCICQCIAVFRREIAEICFSLSLHHQANCTVCLFLLDCQFNQPLESVRRNIITTNISLANHSAWQNLHFITDI